MHLRPLEGLTDHILRRTHAQIFGAADKYFTPFLSPTQDHCLSPRELKQVLPFQPRLAPQLLTAKSGDFLWAAAALRAMGYEEVNLNLGCPSGTVTAKGKGCALLAYPERLERLLEEIFSGLAALDPAPKISLKTRLGVDSLEEFPELLRIFHKYPISELTVHARLGRELYRPGVHQDGFAWAYEQARVPLCYNGDLFTVADCREAERKFPRLAALMLGRGLMADPALIRQLRGGPAAGRQELRQYTARLGEEYGQAFGHANGALPRLKEVWRYLRQSFRGEEKWAKAIAKARSYQELSQAEQAIFDGCEMVK